MKLTKVEVKNYRSVFAASGNSAMTLELQGGMNALAGPNNCGKSNIIRAVALALDPDTPFKPRADIPGPLQWAKPRVTLEFTQTSNYSTERNLFRYADEYERSVLGAEGTTYAQNGILRFQVSFGSSRSNGGSRQEIIGIRGRGARQGDQDLLDKVLKQFRKVVRFVLVESGADLETLLHGKFREILHTVIGEYSKDALNAAEKRRAEYREGLQDDVFAPLSGQIASELRELFPEISAVELIPDVRDIESTLQNAEVRLTDAVETALSSKGTGVRGGVLVAMLRFLADNSRRSMVFAVEEPEAFLHPAAQEDLRDDIEALAERDDVSLLITTHSPFIVSRQPQAQLVTITKDADGRTCVARTASGNEPYGELLGGLLRDQAVGSVLDRSSSIPSSARGILFVEGSTDRDYIQMAAQKASRAELVSDLHIVASSGAKALLVEAVIMRKQTSLPVMALLDSDAAGKEVHDALASGSTFAFKKGSEVLTYSAAFDQSTNVAVEAEDLFPNDVLKAFVEANGEERVLAEKVRVNQLDKWHYGFNRLGKELLPGYLRGKATPDDVAVWIHLLEVIRARMGLADS